MNDTQYWLRCRFVDTNERKENAEELKAAGCPPNIWDSDRWVVQLMHPTSDAPLWECFVSANRHEFSKALVGAQDWMDQNVRVEPCTPTEARQRRLDTSDVDLRIASMFPVSRANTKFVMQMMIGDIAKQNGYYIKQPPVLGRIDD